FFNNLPSCRAPSAGCINWGKLASRSQVTGQIAGRFVVSTSSSSACVAASRSESSSHLLAISSRTARWRGFAVCASRTHSSARRRERGSSPARGQLGHGVDGHLLLRGCFRVVCHQAQTLVTGYRGNLLFRAPSFGKTTCDWPGPARESARAGATLPLRARIILPSSQCRQRLPDGL